MSILQYYTITKKSRSSDQLSSSSSTLPDSRGPLLDKVLTDAITSANAAVAKAIKKSETSRKQKGPYLYLTDAQHCEVGKRLPPLEQLRHCGTTLISFPNFG